MNRILSRGVEKRGAVRFLELRQWEYCGVPGCTAWHRCFPDQSNTSALNPHPALGRFGDIIKPIEALDIVGDIQAAQGTSPRQVTPSLINLNLTLNPSQ